MTGSRDLTILIVIPLAALLTGWAACAGEGPGDSQGKKPPQPETDAELNLLLKARYETAAKWLQSEEFLVQAGKSSLADLSEAWRAVVDSFVELPVSPKERVAMLAKYVDFMKMLEARTEVEVRAGRAGPQDLVRAHYLRADAEIRFLRAKRQATVAP